MPNGPPWADPGEGGGPGRKSLQAPSASEGGIFFASRPQCTREGQVSKEKLVWVLKGASETVSLPAPWWGVREDLCPGTALVDGHLGRVVSGAEARRPEGVWAARAPVRLGTELVERPRQPGCAHGPHHSSPVILLTLPRKGGEPRSSSERLRRWLRASSQGQPRLPSTLLPQAPTSPGAKAGARSAPQGGWEPGAWESPRQSAAWLPRTHHTLTPRQCQPLSRTLGGL